MSGVRGITSVEGGKHRLMGSALDQDMDHVVVKLL